jgi:hypothetical protein
MDGLDALSYAPDMLDPDEEQDYSSMVDSDFISLASKDFRKLIYNIVMMDGGDFQFVVNNLWPDLGVLNPTIRALCCCELLYKALRIKVPSGTKEVDLFLSEIISCSSLPRLSVFIGMQIL